MNKDKDVAEVKSVFQEYEAALSAGDISRIANLFAHDAIVIPGEAISLTDSEAVKSWYKNALEQFTAKQTTRFDELEITGDSAFLRISYTTTLSPKSGGETTTVNGKGSVVYRRQADGSWKAARVIWVGDKALPSK